MLIQRSIYVKRTKEQEGEIYMKEEQFEIPIWKRYTLNIEEAANYYHIGQGKLREIVEEHPEAEFVIYNGNRVLIKRKRFEQYLDACTVI